MKTYLIDFNEMIELPGLEDIDMLSRFMEPLAKVLEATPKMNDLPSQEKIARYHELMQDSLFLRRVYDHWDKTTEDQALQQQLADFETELQRIEAMLLQLQWGILGQYLSDATMTEFMFMGFAATKVSVLNLYRHIPTQRYLNLDPAGNCYELQEGQYQLVTIETEQYLEQFFANK